MSIQTSVIVFQILLSFGLLMFLYFLIKDRIGIIRSIKPKNFKSFFGFDDEDGFIEYLFPIRRRIATIIFNIFGLLIWVPIWIIDKSFQLGIFEEKNKNA